jgi:IS4 transposase
LRLDTPTDDGDAEIILLSNPKGVDPLRICELYRDRWAIERHFSPVKTVLHGEIEDLGRPRAALFAMGIALVAANALNLVRQALRVTHREAETERLSGYYMADEVAGTIGPWTYWSPKPNGGRRAPSRPEGFGVGAGG